MKPDPFSVAKACIDAYLLGVHHCDTSAFWKRHAKDKNLEIARIKDDLADRIMIRNIYSAGPEQDSRLFGTIYLPRFYPETLKKRYAEDYFEGTYVTNEHPSKFAPIRSQWEAAKGKVFRVEFSELGPFATSPDEEDMTPYMKMVIEQCVSGWGHCYVPFEALNKKVESEFDPTFEGTWYSVAFSYT